MPRPPSPRPPGGVPAAWRGAWPEADVGATANLPRFYPEPRGRPRISQRRRVSHRFSLVIQTDNLLSIPSVSKFLITALVYRFRTLLSTLFPISSGSVFRGFWCTCVCDGVRSPLSILLHPRLPPFCNRDPMQFRRIFYFHLAFSLTSSVRFSPPAHLSYLFSLIAQSLLGPGMVVSTRVRRFALRPCVSSMTSKIRFHSGAPARVFHQLRFNRYYFDTRPLISF